MVRISWLIDGQLQGSHDFKDTDVNEIMPWIRFSKVGQEITLPNNADIQPAAIQVADME